MVPAAEAVLHVPVFRSRIRGGSRAALHVLAVAVAVSVIAVDVGADRAAGDGAAYRGDVVAASAAYLVPEDAADDGAHERAGNVGLAALIGDVLALGPAALLR